jgi:hypothetical protein
VIPDFALLQAAARVTRCVGEKIAQNVAQPFFVKLLLPWKKVAHNLGYSSN